MQLVTALKVTTGEIKASAFQIFFSEKQVQITDIDIGLIYHRD